MRNMENGLTLVELLVAVMIAAILAAVAAPSLQTLFHLERATSYSNSMLASLWLTRSEAVKRNTRVVMCKSADGKSCTTDGSWSAGWLVFVDADNNAQRENTEPVLQIQQAWGSGWKGSGNNPVANYVSYTPLGLSQFTSGAFQAGTITICNAVSSSGRKIVINSLGRPRVETTQADSC